jgi:hypothetical protein
MIAYAKQAAFGALLRVAHRWAGDPPWMKNPDGRPTTGSRSRRFLSSWVYSAARAWSPAVNAGMTSCAKRRRLRSPRCPPPEPPPLIST